MKMITFITVMLMKLRHLVCSWPKRSVEAWFAVTVVSSIAFTSTLRALGSWAILAVLRSIWSLALSSSCSPFLTVIFHVSDFI